MANEYFVNSADLTSVADAIRTKGGTAGLLVFPAGFVSAVEAITTGVALNFEVIGGTTRPVNPSENTIWVDTTTDIAGWAFNIEQPATVNNGFVWIETGTKSQFPFNALTENGIYVYLTATSKQLINGVWEDVEFEVFQNGEWISNQSGAIIFDGEWSEGYTGFVLNSDSSSTPSEIFNDENPVRIIVKFQAAPYIPNVDVTEYDYIEFDMDGSLHEDGELGITKNTTYSNPSFVSKIAFGETIARGIYRVNIKEFSGLYNVMLNSWGASGSTVNFYSIKLVKE